MGGVDFPSLPRLFLRLPTRPGIPAESSRRPGSRLSLGQARTGVTVDSLAVGNDCTINLAHFGSNLRECVLSCTILYNIENSYYNTA